MLNHLTEILKQQAEQLKEWIERTARPEENRKMKKILVPAPVKQHEILRGKNHIQF